MLICWHRPAIIAILLNQQGVGMEFYLDKTQLVSWGVSLQQHAALSCVLVTKSNLVNKCK